MVLPIDLYSPGFGAATILCAIFIELKKLKVELFFIFFHSYTSGTNEAITQHTTRQETLSGFD